MSCKAGLRHHPVRLRRPELTESLPGLGRPADSFTITLERPDLSAWRGDIPGVLIYDSGRSGPEIVISALIHGNEYAGACALERLRLTDPMPETGRLTLILGNLDAYATFDPAHPLRSRFRDEDLNRVWRPDYLSGTENSVELARARILHPFIQRADLLLDIHSTLWPSDPLFIVPPRPRSAALGCALASDKNLPSLVVTDLGHVGGSRLIEDSHFICAHGTGRSCLLEAGQHWLDETADLAFRASQRLLHHAESIHLIGHATDAAETTSKRRGVTIVTDNIIARSSGFVFTRPWRGGTIVPKAGTVIARDGHDLICTPYDDCLLIMPNLRPGHGQLAVRLAMPGCPDHERLPGHGPTYDHTAVAGIALHY